MTENVFENSDPDFITQEELKQREQAFKELERGETVKWDDYKKNEDETLWEIHGIRHAIHKDFENKTIEQINQESLAKYLKWKEQLNRNGK